MVEKTKREERLINSCCHCRYALSDRTEKVRSRDRHVTYVSVLLLGEQCTAGRNGREDVMLRRREPKQLLFIIINI